MKKNEAIEQLLEARIKLETEKILKIHEIWVLEEKLTKIDDNLARLGCEPVTELCNILNSKKQNEIN